MIAVGICGVYFVPEDSAIGAIYARTFTAILLCVEKVLIIVEWTDHGSIVGY